MNFTEIINLKEKTIYIYPLDLLKVRIWDDVVKKMYTPNNIMDVRAIYDTLKDIFENQVEKNLPTPFGLINNPTKPYGKFDFMRCTAILDKGNNYIYENDVVEWDNGINSGIGVVTYDYQNMYYKVGDFKLNELLGQMKILGNIYQNPSYLQIKEDKLKF